METLTVQKCDAGELLNNQSRLAWACRRGMLELDVLLSRYLNEAYFLSTESEKIAFIQLLEVPDPDLFAYLMGQAAPTDPDLASIVMKVRQHAVSRF